MRNYLSFREISIILIIKFQRMSLSLHLNHFAFNINYPRVIKKKKKSSNVRIVIVKIIHKLFHDRQIQQETVVFKTSITEKKKKTCSINMEISKAALVPRTVSSNRSFSYAIFKRRIHDALTTILFQEFFHFLFIYSSSFLYIYIYVRRRAKAIYYHQYGPSDIFFFFSLLFFFFFSICHGSKHLFLLRIEAHDLIDSSALLIFFPADSRSIRVSPIL